MATPAVQTIVRKQERRARTSTALTLVDPAELALLEHMYDDDLWSIADELNVTMQVLADYQAMNVSPNWMNHL